MSARPYQHGQTWEEMEAAYRRILLRLIQGIAEHAVEGKQSEYHRFRRELDESQKRLSGETTISELVRTSGTVLRSMEDYNRRTSKFLHGQNQEIRPLPSLRPQSGGGPGLTVSKLQEIDELLEQMDILKLGIAERLGIVREELGRRNQADTAKPLKLELEQPQDRPGVIQVRHELDPATGLPVKADAQAAIEAAVALPQGKYLLIAVCSRMQAINARFGYAVGDKILADFAKHFRTNLTQPDQIFRWQGPALVGLLERGGRIDVVRSEIRRFADERIEKTIEVGPRTILIPISAAWSVLPVTESLVNLYNQIDAFLAAQFPRDYA